VSTSSTELVDSIPIADMDHLLSIGVFVPIGETGYPTRRPNSDYLTNRGSSLLLHFIVMTVEIFGNGENVPILAITFFSADCQLEAPIFWVFDGIGG
jgi:hypothetical protein